MLTHLISPVLLALSLTTTPSTEPQSSAPTPNGAALASDPLVITCPVGPVKVLCGLPYGPEVAGEPTADGGCAPYTFSYRDVATTPVNCQAERFVQSVTRTWTVTDACGNSTSCDQVIHVVKDLVYLDLHPRSCPNPLNRQNSGKYPAAILGTPSFDVTTIVPGSLRLYVLHCAGGGSLAPIPAMTTYEDVSAPYTGGAECGCTTNGPDGYMDLIFKFDRRALVTQLGLNGYPAFSDVKLVITGDLTNGCRFIGLDCVRVQ
ncbi:MAG: hypothetical protein HZA53_13140 [Planctomycetes bacterium]|nr:hypothetical protein [Planctomycetota bacterium]